MKQTLLSLVFATIVSFVFAQKKITAYAITGPQKGQSGWTEVRVVDITTGDELRSIYKTSNQVEILNARTGKPVQVKVLADVPHLARVRSFNGPQNGNNSQLLTTAPPTQLLRMGRRQGHLSDPTKGLNVNTTTNNSSGNNSATNVQGNATNTPAKIVTVAPGRISSDKPFATNSAALAYDKKHDRLYYTPMNIPQLRYIDLKTGKVFYFEDETFGVLKGRGDVKDQITRMVFASDGNGYALTNDGKHFIRFTTGKKPVITDLGALTDAPTNGSYSIHNRAHFGGDMIADVDKNIYLIGADRSVFKIGIESKVASFIGKIKGLPTGFSTNGAIAEGGSTVIVTSSTSTIGYYRFDLNTLEAEKVSTGNSVFNASDLANGILAFENMKKKKEPEPVFAEALGKDLGPTFRGNETGQAATIHSSRISVFPNPAVSGGALKLSFVDQLPGKYQVELLDVSGRVVSRKQLVINNKVQVEAFQLPEQISNGNYLLKVLSEAGNTTTANKIVIQ